MEEVDQKKQKLPAIFLDRDGTINEEVGFLDSLEKLRLIPGAARAISMINESGFKAIVVTNQSGVARGLFDEEMVAAAHQKIQKMLLEKGARIDAFFYCPHHPTASRGIYLKNCPCRKPAPGMLLRAKDELMIALEDSYIIGDTLNDIEAGAKVGVKGVLVKTGYGGESAARLADATSESENIILYRPVKIAADLEEAVRWIIMNQNKSEAP
jgi:D-glycero-D-manno-heptose 1,7-bisphosphate phosphatase